MITGHRQNPTAYLGSAVGSQLNRVQWNAHIPDFHISAVGDFTETDVKRQHQLKIIDPDKK